MKPRISELMKPLEAPDAHHLLAAEGWIELGNHAEANQELEQIAPQLRAHPDVLEVRGAFALTRRSGMRAGTSPKR